MARIEGKRILNFFRRGIDSAPPENLQDIDAQIRDCVIEDLVFEANLHVEGARDILDAIEDGKVIVATVEAQKLVVVPLVRDSGDETVAGILVNASNYKNLEKGQRKMAVGQAARKLYRRLRIKIDDDTLTPVTPNELRNLAENFVR